MAVINPGLTARQLRFVQEYVIDANATQAAIRSGYSIRSAKQIGSRQMTKVDVQAMVGVEMQKIGRKTETSSAWVRRRLREEAEDFTKGSNAASRVRAIELIARLNGDFVADRRNARSPLEDFGTEALKELEQALAERQHDTAVAPDRTNH